MSKKILQWLLLYGIVYPVWVGWWLYVKGKIAYHELKIKLLRRK